MMRQPSGRVPKPMRNSGIRNWFSDHRGNVAITFALAIIPVFGAMGIAVDYSMANSARTNMQDSLDATGIALQRQMPLTQTQIDTIGNAFFLGNLGNSPLSNITLTIASGTSTLTLDATGTYNTTLARVLTLVGMGTTLPVGAHSVVKWGVSRLRVALVLDNTGSMADSGKMSALQTATKNLLTQLQNAVTNAGDVYVSIIPFVKDVNLDPSNYNASWIYWGTATQDPTRSDNNSWDANNGTCSKSSYSTRSTCKAKQGTWTPKNHNTWNGCVMDRGGPTTPSSANYDTNVVAPSSSNNATLYAAEQYSSCPQAAMGLNYNWSAMTTLVNNMSPAGNTNQAIGLQLGWLSLVGGGPFTAPAMGSNYTYSQVIILLTDGLNTQDRWYSSQSSIDTRQQMTCNNVKAAGITLYTVQVNTGGDPTSTLLQNCASSSDKFFLLTSSSQIVSTFQQIGTAISNLHLSQ
jgi:Flp pilus assembly protein TadG